MLGAGIDVTCVTFLDDAPRVHDIDPVRIACHHAQIVCNDDQPNVHFPAQALHELQNLCLDCDVQGGGGLVGDDQLGVTAQCHGDHHPLPHAPAEMVGILTQAIPGLGNADPGQ